MADIVEERLATKEDIAILQRDMKDMEYRMTIRLGAMLAVSITLMGALVKLL